MVTDDDRRTENETSRNDVLSNGDRRQRFDEILAALADTRRRYVLYYLRSEKRGSVTDVARQIVAWEEAHPSEDAPDELLEDLILTLHHAHLPKLRKAALIEYDERSKQLVFCDPPKLAERCLEYCMERDLNS